MAMVQIDEAKLARLKRDAKLTESIRTARGHGATVTYTQPLQSINIMIDKLSTQHLEDRDAIKAALVTAMGG